MSGSVITVEGVAKRYALGESRAGIGSRTFRDAFDRFLRRRVAGRGGGASAVAGEIWALKDVSFEAQEGEILGIIGRNGAGKSTLLRILSRITRPTRGRAVIRARVASLLEVGTGFSMELTGRENIFLNGAILGMKRAEIIAQFDSIADFADIAAFLDTPVKRYSTGMYLRLAFAVAAHLQPEVLIIDEVLAVGDFLFQKKCLTKMSEIASSGRTILFVSHNMAAVRSLCTRALLLEEGRIAGGGTTHEVVEQYLTRAETEHPAVLRLPPPAHDSAAMVRALAVLSADDEPGVVYPIGRAWKVTLELQATRPVSGLIAAIGLMSVEGVPIVTYWSQPTDLAPGIYTVEFPVDLLLAHGAIRFNVGLSSNGITFSYLQDVGHVTISEVADGAQPYRVSGTGVLSSVNRPLLRPGALPW
jgi:lipopolysaccharide transport system ATP-binding protein